MPAAPARFLDRLRSALAPDDRPDARLVTRFARTADAGAFAELVRRHGPMVLAVCRRVVGDRHLAEDAFQATFLVLARKAGVVRPPAAVGAFLHGVAVRTALDARTMAARRRTATLPDLPAADPCPADAELFRALDEEVARLPDHLRAAVVPVELEGRSRKDVAESLGIPEGTLSSRLAKARKVLADRLRRRGFGLPATLAAAVAVPPELAAAAAGLASPVTIPPVVAVLAAGVTRMMFVTRLTTAAALGLGAMILGVVLAPPVTADPDPPRLRPARLAPPAKPVPRPTHLLAWRRGQPTLYSPDGKVVTELPNADFADRRGRAILSPDGRQMAYAVSADALQAGGVRLFLHALWVRPVGDTGPGKALSVEGQPTAWSRDGKRLYGVGLDVEAAKAGRLQTTNWVYDLAAGTHTALDLPQTFTVADESPDGKHLLACETDMADGAPFTRTHLLGRDGRRVAVLVEKGEPYTPVRFSPDGKRVLLVCQMYGGPGMRLVTEETFAVYDFVGEKLTKFKPAGLPRYHMVEPGAACWSPDGAKVAFTWVELLDPKLLPKAALPGVPAPGLAPPGGAVPPPPPPGNLPLPVVPAPVVKNPFPWTVSVMDADGKNVKELATDKARGFSSLDWK